MKQQTTLKLPKMSDHEFERYRSLNANGDVSGAANAFSDRDYESIAKDFVPTGFEILDERLTGGIGCPGLHCLGGNSSVGKSTLAMQIAEAMSAQGQPVLYISREMSVTDMIAKSVSRHLRDAEPNADPKVIPSMGMLCNRSYLARRTPEQWAKVDSAVETVRGNTALLTVYGPDGEDMTVTDIAKFVKQRYADTGRKDFVTVDYLQIIEPDRGFRPTDERQRLDHVVKTLKALAEEMEIGILLLSSFNRAAENHHPDKSSFMMSSLIIYSCDTLLGLETASSNKYSRDVLLWIVKNRAGETDMALKFQFEPRFNRFIENGVADVASDGAPSGTAKYV